MRVILFTVLFVLSISAFGQKKIKRTNNFTNYKQTANEFGYGLNLAYLKFNRTFAPQLHLHYAYYVSDFFSIGAGYGGIYGEAVYNTLNFESSFRLQNKLIISLKPGFTIKNFRGSANLLYSFGLEFNYEIEVAENIHIGPLAEITFFQDELSYVAGFHMGFGF